jgi:hypothetical protein
MTIQAKAVLIEQTRATIGQLQNRIMQLEDEKRKIETELEPSKRVLEHFMATLAFLTKGASPAQSEQETQIKIESGIPVPQQLEESEYGGKADAIKGVISEFADWFTPMSIRDKTAGTDNEVSENYIYKILRRMVAEGRLERSGRRYRLKPEERAA